LWLALGAGEAGSVTTIELNPERAEQARANLLQADREVWTPAFPSKPAPITLREGDALEVMPGLEGPFDLIFVDAAKGQYPGFLSQVEGLLRVGGLLVADNVLFRGLVALQPQEVDRRFRTLVGRLRSFLETISTQKGWDTSILPIGDGVSVSCKVEV
ncbi:MAG TPA: O-methyltransferase, partial [Bacillota bacterium]|nr:O-methyltransferase [Bacillota bacterium]